MSAVEWSIEELKQEAKFPLALRLPPLEPLGERPVFRRAPAALIRGSKDRDRWRGYYVEYRGQPLLLLEARRSGPKYNPPWFLQKPAWQPAVLRLLCDWEKLLHGALRALRLVVTVDLRNRIIAVAREGNTAGWLKVLQEAGWRPPEKRTGYCYPPAWRGPTQGKLVAALWQHIGTATLEDALLTLEVTGRLAGRWEADRHPRLLRAFRNSWIHWRRTWKTWIDKKLGPRRARRLQRQIEWERNRLERTVAPSAAREFLGEMS